MENQIFSSISDFPQRFSHCDRWKYRAVLTKTRCDGLVLAIIYARENIHAEMHLCLRMCECVWEAWAVCRCVCVDMRANVYLWLSVRVHLPLPSCNDAQQSAFGTWSGDPAVHSPVCPPLWALFHTAQPSANCHSNEGWSPSYGWWITKKESTCQAGRGENTAGRRAQAGDDDWPCLSLISEVWMRRHHRPSSTAPAVTGRDICQTVREGKKSLSLIAGYHRDEKKNGEKRERKEKLKEGENIAKRGT